MKYLRKFENNAAYESATLDLPNVAYCEEENEVHYNPIPHDYSEDYLTFVALEDGTFTFTPQNNNVISYSTDNGENWAQGNSISVNSGDKIMWKGTMISATYAGVGKFSSTGNFDIQGNVMSLLFGDNFKGQTDLTGKDWVFYYLFNQNTKVINAKNLSLPATILATYCYRNMFYGCTGLVSTPELPTTVLASFCYNGMFRDCSSLTTTPKLPATTLASYCYQSMFRGCTSLTTVLELPVATLADGCYSQMFYDCTSLTTAPELPATTLASACYQNMFTGCISLTEAPDLLAETLVDNCYNSMFQNCTNLNYIKAMFTTPPSISYTRNWVNGVASTGTFVKNSAAQWDVSGVHGIPNGWTVETASE